MAYTPTYPDGWEDAPSENTPITAEALNAIDDGLTDAVSASGGSTITNAGTGAALSIVQDGVTSASTSTGGALNINNSNNTGQAIALYTTQASTVGRLMTLNVDSTTFTEAAFHVDYTGSGNAFEVVATSETDDATPLTVTNNNWTASTIGLASDVENHGVIKTIHTFPSAGAGSSGDDSIGSFFSMDWQGVGTKVQGIFGTTTTEGGGTTGNLIQFDNGLDGEAVTTVFVVAYNGKTSIGRGDPFADLDIQPRDLTGVTSEQPVILTRAQAIDVSAALSTYYQNQFTAPTISNSGGGSVAKAATVYISGAPSGDAIPDESQSYALLVNGICQVVGNLVATTIYSDNGFANKSTANNALLNTSATGITISRNQADANPALLVNQRNAGSTGDIVTFQAEGVTVASMTQGGDLSFAATGQGVILKSPNGTQYRLSVDDDGTLSADAV